MTAKSTALWKVVVDGFRLELWESHSWLAYNYTMAFSILAQPERIALVYLGEDAEEAMALFCQKVEYHRRLST